MPIQVLPEAVASQIAAGEVVERPASVVKELLENALDAGAKTVQISVEGAGKGLIEVLDDGEGIPAEELELAVSRHATSKLSQSDDLFRIESLGFRGEALASIGSVSRLTITSRSRNSEAGARIRVAGGEVEPLSPIGAPFGTSIRVEDLFYNVPARRKFLKTDRTERRKIDELVTRYALAYPEVRLSLTQEGRRALQSSGNGDRRELLGEVYGAELARKMVAVNARYEDLTVEGFVSPVSYTRSNRREINFFINGRWVQDPALTAAVVQAYHTLLMVGRYPLAILFLDVPPESVDVNVHPAKAEVRFRKKDRVFSGLQRAVRRALLAHTPVPDLRAGPDWTDGVEGASAGAGLGWDSLDREGQPKRDALARPGQPAAAGPGEQGALPDGGVPLLRLIGQVGATYLVAEGPDGLYLIDQHAAHERVLFERLLAQAEEDVPSQGLLSPVTVELPPASARILEEQLPVLSSFGFEVELFGPGTYLVRALPELLSKMNPAAALRVLVEDFEEDEAPLREELEARLIARVCKRAAIKAGQVLSGEEQRALLDDLERCQNPRTCPHGRPTMIHLSVDLLERQFGRRGSR